MSNYAEMLDLGYLLRKNMALRLIQILTLAGAIKIGRKGGGMEYIEHLQLFVQSIKFLKFGKIKKNKTILLKNFFDTCHIF